jgi:hypothetical protein
MIYLIQKEEVIIVSLSVDEGWQDTGTLENWDRYSPDFIGIETGFKDWKCLRKIISNLVFTIVGPDFSNWNKLTDAEKKIACKYIPNRIPPKLYVEVVPNADERLDMSSYFDKQSTKARMSRFERGRLEIFGNFTANDCYWVLDKICPDIELRYYGGIEKESEDGYFGLLDWVNINLRESGKVPTSGLSLNTVCDNILDILETGNY